MKNILCAMKWFLTAIVLVSLSSTVFAKGSELEFRATVAEINQVVDGDSILTISVFSDSSDFDFAILVTSSTKIESSGNSIALSELEIGEYIRVRAFFSAAGIVAEDIDLLDGRVGQFRLRGEIDNLLIADDGTFLEILGVSVLANTNTTVWDRSLDASRTVDSLVAGELVDAKGRVVDATFVAKRIMVGERREGKVEFEGTITQANGGTIIVNTKSGASLTVITNDATRIRGNLVINAFVEVEGLLNEQLHVVADEVKVDANGNGDAGDDDHGRDGRDDDENENEAEFSREVSLTNVGGNARIDGKVKFKHESKNSGVQQEFEVEIEDAPADTTYGISVNFGDGGVNFGNMTTNRFGRAEIEFDSSPETGEIQIAPLLPNGKDVRDIQLVEITLNGTVVLTASF